MCAGKNNDDGMDEMISEDPHRSMLRFHTDSNNSYSIYTVSKICEHSYVKTVAIVVYFQATYNIQ